MMAKIMTHLDFIDHIEGIGKACIRENDLIKSIRQAVRSHFAMAERVLEIGERIAHGCMSTEDDQPGDGDEYKR